MYSDLIEQALYAAVPYSNADKKVRFEAIVAEIIGTKQRRFGPMPSPEVQVGIREVVRQSGDHIRFFLPWACRKQDANKKFDLLEFYALKQLLCLREGLKRMGVESKFYFRLEDLTDLWLFNADTGVNEYARAFDGVVSKMLPGSIVNLESDFTSYTLWHDKATEYKQEFLQYFAHGREPDLPGWQPMPPEQLQYYRDLNQKLYPQANAAEKMADYFAAVLARKTLNAVGHPSGPFIFITFAHPVPGNPIQPNRLFYRTLPERFTNKHVSPWMTSGYFRIKDMTNEVCPRFVEEGVDVIPNESCWDGVKIATDYAID